MRTIFVGLFLRIENVFLYLQLLNGFVVGEKLDYPLQLSLAQGEHD